MGKIISALVIIITVWGALAQIMPDLFQVRRNDRLRLMQFLWGSKSIWVAAIAVACLLAWYIWFVSGEILAMRNSLHTLEALSTTLSTASPKIDQTDETGLRFASWWLFPDGSGCGAVIDASKLPTQLRDKFEIALVCGLSNPTIDRLKDTRITLSSLFTLQDTILITAPFSKTTAETLANDSEAAMKKIQPKPPHGTFIGLTSLIWMKAVLLPKGFDIANIHRLADVPLNGGKIANFGAEMGITRNVPFK